jgi:hypothetical protein
MGNIVDYVKKYRTKSFKEKKLCDVDMLVFSALAYMDFTEIVNRDRILLNDALKFFYKMKNKEEFINRGIGQVDIWAMGKEMIDQPRYNSIYLSNYVYKVTKDEQFSAITMHLPNGFTIVVFEGTDHHVVGWEEDFKMIYQYPVKAHIDACKYLNKTLLSIKDNKIILAGHSKGGHLALASAMGAIFPLCFKIKAIYNFDGPCLPKDLICLPRYKKFVSKRTHHIVPSYTFFGILLKHTPNYEVVKPTINKFTCHAPTNWYIEDDHFVKERLSKQSVSLNRAINKWLDNHNRNEKKVFCDTLFKVLKEAEIENMHTAAKLPNIRKILNSYKELDKSSKDLIVEFIKINISTYAKDRITTTAHEVVKNFRKKFGKRGKKNERE